MKVLFRYNLMVVLILFTIVIMGCSSSYSDLEISKNDQEIIIIRNGVTCTYKFQKRIDGDFRVVSLGLGFDKQLKKDGVEAFLNVILLEEMPENRPFTDADFNNSKDFVLIPADSFVYSDLKELLSNKSCYLKLRLKGDLIFKIRENDTEFKNFDMPYLLLEEVQVYEDN